MAPLSYWHDSLAPGDADVERPALGGDTDADVAIVGAGFSGLWTAYYLLRADPSLRVVVVERETAGFGASGRNGGWCVGDQSAPLPMLAKAAGPDAARAMVTAVHEAVDEVGDVTRREDIDCGYTKGGAVYLATTRRQLARLDKVQRTYARYGHGDGYALLGPAETTAIVHATDVVGSLFTPHAAAVHPARLVRGLALAVERLGGTIHEHTAVRSITAGGSDGGGTSGGGTSGGGSDGGGTSGGASVRTDQGTVRAPIVVRATEAYSASIEGQGRQVQPLGSYMIATEPLPDAVWDEIGLANRELFEDSALMLGYGQRTADGRIAWGGRSAPSWFASRVPPSPMADARISRRLRDRLVERFPVLADVEVSHHWGGVLGVARDLRPGVGLDRSTGLAWIGGYFGSGVAASNAAGRTLADLVTGAATDRSRLPWVGHRSRRWEPEPLRWLEVHAATTAARLTDLFDR